ncbi:DNA gyrase inhibitor YacG [Aromatoleum diolicum]|uniref:DNA gyrase inhibitor YacG n=1 Tax=Aromatoleum diolicum TaxID=75796 RepID=A0ABX1Q970_9RHOO|nr:DNA gyrase inhibitor YacG [Aromatoleum diolicum]NMG73571.1 DNA gyrase inhibitor YacG [Aromatoleum diolicum]
MSKVRTVKCPQCGASVQWLPENRFRPFCSERCKQIDLGAWASENYRVPAPSGGEVGDPEHPGDSSTQD